MSGFNSHSGSSASAPYSSAVIDRSAYWHDSTKSSRLSCQSARTTLAGSDLTGTRGQLEHLFRLRNRRHLDHLPEAHVGVIDGIAVLIEGADLHVGHSQADFNIPGHSETVSISPSFVYCSSLMVPVRSAQRGGAFLDSTRERPQPNRILCAGRGGVALELGGQLAELLQDGGGAIVAPRTQPVNALEGGRHRTGTVRLDSLAAHELVEIRARDHDARRPGDPRLLLRVELGRVDEQGGVDFVLRQMLARLQPEDVEAARDLRAVDVAVVPVGRPVSARDELLRVERTRGRRTRSRTASPSR